MSRPVMVDPLGAALDRLWAWVLLPDSAAWPS